MSPGQPSPPGGTPLRTAHRDPRPAGVRCPAVRMPSFPDESSAPGEVLSSGRRSPATDRLPSSAPDGARGHARRPRGRGRGGPGGVALAAHLRDIREARGRATNDEVSEPLRRDVREARGGVSPAGGRPHAPDYPPAAPHPAARGGARHARRRAGRGRLRLRRNAPRSGNRIPCDRDPRPPRHTSPLRSASDVRPLRRLRCGRAAVPRGR